MEITARSSLPKLPIPNPCSSSASCASSFSFSTRTRHASQPKAASRRLVASTSLPFQCSNGNSLTSPKLQFPRVFRIKTEQLTSTIGISPIFASSMPETPPTSTDASPTWLLEPVGDGDSRHIGFKVPMPNAFEISSNEVTVGRLPEKADMVIPVATVSGVHARIQQKDGNLLVADLDSTNGTFIEDKRLSPGVVYTVPPGSVLTFGDEHLAVFRVSKLKNVEAAINPDPSEDKLETDIPNEKTETS